MYRYTLRSLFSVILIDCIGFYALFQPYNGGHSISTMKAMKKHGDFQRIAKVIRKIEICSPFSLLGIPFSGIVISLPWFSRFVLLDGNCYPRERIV